MNSIEYYTELIIKLNERIREIEEQNIALRDELNFSKGKLEMLSGFYNDFKHLIMPDNVSSISTKICDTAEAKHYSVLVTQYLTTHDVDVINTLFSNYPDDIRRIFTDIRNHFPDNVEELVEKYGYREEYEIIKKSIKHIHELETNGRSVEKGMVELIGNYIKSYNYQKKSSALRYLKQALIYYPLLFDEAFLNKIKSYWYDDMEEYVNSLKKEYYGNSVVLKTTTTKSPKVKKPKQVKTEKTNSINYASTEISEIIDYVKNVKNNHRQRALDCYSRLEKHNRTDEELLTFIDGVNSFLPKKI